MSEPLTVPKPESNLDYELTPSGTHVATIFKIVNLGTLTTEWQGQERQVPKIRIFWEIPGETKTFTDKEGNDRELPFAISRKLTLSMGEKSNLLPLVKGMTGTSFSEEEAYNFDIFSLLGLSCLINVVHEKSKDGDRTYAVVNSASALPKGMEAPAPVNEQVIWNVRDMSRDEIMDLPEYISKDMVSSQEFHVRFDAPRGDASPSVPEAVDEAQKINPEDIPF